MVPVLIFGAGSGVGLCLARLLRRDGVPVFAMLRSPAAEGELAAIGVRTVSGDAFSMADIDRALALPGTQEFDVVSTIGGRGANGRRADDDGNINIADRAAVREVRRFMLVTSIGCGDMAPFRSERAIAAFGEAVDAKTRAEEHLRRRLPAATVIRRALTDPATEGRVFAAVDADQAQCVNPIRPFPLAG